MRKMILALVLLLVPHLAQALERPDRPHWSLELKGGAFFPAAGRWSAFYGSNYMGEYGGALSYKIIRQLEVGIAGSYARATGKGQLANHPGQRSGEATYRQAPLELFVLARGVVDENQWLVPYAGGGYTRLFYRVDLKGAGRTEGSVNGYHARGGVQLLLDRLEPESGETLYREYGLHHTYFFVEGKYTRPTADAATGGSVNLGGASCLGGFLFEF